MRRLAFVERAQLFVQIAQETLDRLGVLRSITGIRRAPALFGSTTPTGLSFE